MKKYVLVIVAVLIVGVGVFALLKKENVVIVENSAAIALEPVSIINKNSPSIFVEEAVLIPKLEILDTSVGYLNVRNGASLQSTKIGTVKPGEIYEFTDTKDNWYHLVHEDFENAWVSGLYVKEIN